jgi:hypothetical protein
VLNNSDHKNHVVLAKALHAHLRWRDANARHPDVIAAQRKERAPHPLRTQAAMGQAGTAAA